MQSFLDYKKLFNFSIPKMIDEIMFSLSDEIIELNQVEQLSEGIDAKGQKIKTIRAQEQGQGNVYSLMAINERSKKGLQTNKVDLNFSGSFWKTFAVKKVKTGWLVSMNFELYGDDIRENFDSGFDFSGLTNDNLDYLVNEYLFPRLEKKIYEQIFVNN